MKEFVLVMTQEQQLGTENEASNSAGAGCVLSRAEQVRGKGQESVLRFTPVGTKMFALQNQVRAATAKEKQQRCSPSGSSQTQS